MTTPLEARRAAYAVYLDADAVYTHCRAAWVAAFNIRDAAYARAERLPADVGDAARAVATADFDAARDAYSASCDAYDDASIYLEAASAANIAAQRRLYRLSQSALKSNSPSQTNTEVRTP